MEVNNQWPSYRAGGSRNLHFHAHVTNARKPTSAARNSHARIGLRDVMSFPSMLLVKTSILELGRGRDRDANPAGGLFVRVDSLVLFR